MNKTTCFVRRALSLLAVLALAADPEAAAQCSSMGDLSQGTLHGGQAVENYDLAEISEDANTNGIPDECEEDSLIGSSGGT